jgi:integrase
VTARNERRTRPKLDLSSKRARLKAPPDTAPYWQTMDGGGWQLGYRVPTTTVPDKSSPKGIRLERIPDRAGAWSVRWWNEHDRSEQRRSLRVVADDYGPADGVRVLNFKMALERGRKLYDDERGVQRGKNAGRRKKTVGTVFEAYARSREVAGHDMSGSRSRYKLHIAKRWGDVPVERLTVEALTEWLEELASHRKGEKVEPTEGTRATANRVFGVLRAALNHGVKKQGIRPQFAVWKSVEVLPNANGHREHVLKPAEIKRLVNACDAEIRPLVLATTFTGARFGDVRELRARDVDLVAKAVRLRGMKTRNKTTRKGYLVALSDEAVKFFKALVAGRAPDDLLITRLDGSRWGASAYRRQLVAANGRAGIKPAASLYTLRHSYATNLIEGGAAVHVIASAMGHADERMVLQHYEHRSDQWQNDQVRAALPTIGVRIGKTNVVPIDEPKKPRARRTAGRKS